MMACQYKPHSDPVTVWSGSEWFASWATPMSPFLAKSFSTHSQSEGGQKFDAEKFLLLSHRPPKSILLKLGVNPGNLKTKRVP